MTFLFRIDIGYEQGRGYIAMCQDIRSNETNCGKALSIRELMRHVSQVISNQEQKSRHFPMDNGPCIVIPNKAEKDIFGFQEPQQENGE